jgi:membrane-associated protease RseP (regulator of RpoE activity)
MSFIGILETIGKDFAKGLKFAITYAVPVEKLVAILFPASAPAVATLAGATTLIQNAVLLVEQKFAAANQQTGTGQQKLDEVLTLTQATVTQLLATAGITANTAYVTSLINAVVAILNVQPAPAVAAK